MHHCPQIQINSSLSVDVFCINDICKQLHLLNKWQSANNPNNYFLNVLLVSIFRIYFTIITA